MVPANRGWREGIVVGLIAYASVAVFYSLFDLLAARGALYTVSMLGRAVFRDLRDPGVLQYPVRPDLTAVFWYNGLHLLVSLAIGLVVVGLIEHAEQRPARARLVLITIVGGFVVTVLGVGLLTAPMRPVLPWWSIVVANGLATLLAAVYLLRRRPGLWRRLSGSADAPRGGVVT
jgi:hypothetical protein